MAQQTIIAYFDTRSQAESARDGLIDNGIAASAIALLPEEESTYVRPTSETSYDHRKDEGGFWSSLGGFFLPDEDRYNLAEGMSRGGAALSVMTDDAHHDDVADLLEKYGADDIDAREAEWKSAGWAGYVPGDPASATSASSTNARLTSGDDTIQVVEEQLRVGKRVTDRGRVRVRSYVVETPVEAEVELSSSRVILERRPVDRVATDADFAMSDRTLEATEHREEAVVSKEARVVEEIDLRQEAQTRTETVRDTVRKTEVEIEDERATGVSSSDVSRTTDRR